ncbi:succinate dehydrogenase/fumarate reductase flavoprotein subunit [Streptomyces sp. 3330]|uniref:hypothetical protein n=1 Tax=Streptomyces sp. 3330 TaxID=2817755 RepID=UPI0028619A1E|nr:hypothetical protein [Streptomyces sp. 3330]MDR6981359.1 succinate dehydrogenase/fumarate reductase flavoprotein subunit [Streptomyces sp. 3330]
MKHETKSPHGVDEWATHVQDLLQNSDSGVTREVVAEIYRSAQDELDQMRAQAEFEREE